MAKKSIIIRNWPKYIMQWGVLTALIAFIAGFIPSEMVTDHIDDCLPCCTASLQIIMGAALLIAVIMFSRLFCGYICPVGTVQDIIVKIRTRIRMKSIKVSNGSITDKALRIVKYVLLFWIFYIIANSGFDNELTFWISTISACILVVGSIAVDMFWCRYVCPLGAISNSFKFWIWMLIIFGAYTAANLLGANISWTYLLGAFCVTGYGLEIFNGKPKLQILHITKNEVPCNKCGVCKRVCPYHIDHRSFHNGKINHVDCTLCCECVEACPCGALTVGTDKPTRSKLWRAIPPILAIALIAALVFICMKTGLLSGLK